MTGQAPGAAFPHYVNPDPFDPDTATALTPEQERYYMASQWMLMW